ncbi:MAG: hydroxymethylglutaryl-CoA lyase, partial [Pseudomonadota bacterium]|nr:hydroxymethylglutaryl-CoA lyase [Pseudomonadota bacterium]
MARPTKVEITEVGPRDGLQAELNFIPTDAKIRFVNGLIAAGVPRIEFSSFVSPKAIPQLSDVVEVFKGIERTKPCTLAALVPNAHGAIRAVEAKVDEMIVFMSASESHNQKNVNRSIDESLDGFERVAQIAGDAGIPVHGAIATGFGCPFEGDVSLDTIVKIAKRYHEYGFTGVGLGDTTGMATPPIVTKFVRTLQDAGPEMDIALHFHNTRGIGLVNVVAGLDEGIDKYDASFAGIGGCPFAPKATGNICTEDLVYMLDEMG